MNDYMTILDWYLQLPRNMRKAIDKTILQMSRVGMGTRADCLSLIYGTTRR